MGIYDIMYLSIQLASDEWREGWGGGGGDD